jgi:UDP-N-acetyl-D-mannosaminuronic acid dehydrogenase
LYQLPQIVGGVTPRATERARQLFQKSAPSTIELTPTEAELGKLFANAHRYISFATSNQFYIIAYRFGADFDRIHQAVTQDYPRMAGFAKAGLAAGPCLLKDTMQLGAFNHNAFVLGQAAMMVNEGLPRVLVEIAKARFPLAEMRTAILGMAFKGDNDDPRDSLAYKLRKLLAVESRAVLCTDPYIQDSRFVPLEQALREAELLFVGACHKEYRDLEIAEPVIDVFGFLRRATNKVRAAGQPASARAVAF